MRGGIEAAKNGWEYDVGAQLLKPKASTPREERQMGMCELCGYLLHRLMTPLSLFVSLQLCLHRKQCREVGSLNGSIRPSLILLVTAACS